MDYWQNVWTATGMGRAYPSVLLGSILAALVLGAALPQARVRLRTSVILLLISMLGMFICGVMLQQKINDDASAYRWTHFASHMCMAVGLINIFGILVFRVLLAPV